ncbi:type III-B CRISPR module RAMP protein Cmr1 [Rivihabitans pingtungensis]|uniref:CRISPR type III-B/RAMP module RAMP protein Cmr1 n=1 Tax=Rivihabitans pingtungensis TaxID=1054498 RepID=A0A318KV42_9NEIS|nr:type III-B CRISPR module RAMP protein Cmr1 [Rivihabitans pingtungensis]PXX81784.1 CRISPR type III-B/RAMP module RAMP protein Cmr1 [Rivihabitans pingtungensis]
MPLRRLPSISSAEPSTPPAVGVASLEKVEKKKTWLDSQEARDAEPIHWKSYECLLVTPLFGGGVVAGQVDQRMPIRASAIRGQLRFWWRLLASKRLGDDVNAIRQEEFALWGGLGTPPQASRVWVEVRHDKPLKFTAVENINSYALAGADRKPGDILYYQSTWHLYIGFERSHLTSAQCDQVMEAVQWWANFGGVGARTRRGFGCVLVPKCELLTPQDVREKLGGTLVFSSAKFETAFVAWEHAIVALKLKGKKIENRQGYLGPERQASQVILRVRPTKDGKWQSLALMLPTVKNAKEASEFLKALSHFRLKDSSISDAREKSKKETSNLMQTCHVLFKKYQTKS